MPVFPNILITFTYIWKASKCACF